MVCGSNNCLKFGAYYHEKDDCCERPARRDCTTVRQAVILVLFFSSIFTNNLYSGFYPDKECIFPFEYKGVVHRQCTWEDSEYRHNQPWCATATSRSGEALPRHWGNCAPACPVEETPPVVQVSQVSQVWGPWSDFSPCSSQCGGGQTLRYRECHLADLALCPHLNQTQIRSCNLNPCN